MTELEEGNLVFNFPSNVDEVTKYDEWSFYRNQFSKLADGTKAVDFIFLEQDTCWLIEVKDYRVNRRTKLIDLADEVSIKVKDTIAGLFTAKINANDRFEKNFAQSANRKSRIRVVLHLEQPTKPSKLFPAIVNEADIKSKLKSKIRAVDPHPIVMNKNSSVAAVSWTITP
jgi:hypothetical protein